MTPTALEEIEELEDLFAVDIRNNPQRVDPELHGWKSRDLDLSPLVLRGRATAKWTEEIARVEGSLLPESYIERTMEGASYINLEFHDPERFFFTLKAINKELDVKMGPAGSRDWYRLVKFAKNEDAMTLGFEDRLVNWLRHYDKYIKAYRDALTRAEFFLRMIREVKEGPIPFYSPELHKDQPIAPYPGEKRAEAERNRKRKPGINKEFSLKVWTTSGPVDAHKDQITNAEAALDIAEDMNAPYRARVALIAAMMVECQIRNCGGGDDSSVGWLQLLDIHYGGSYSERRNMDRVVRDFLKKGFCGHGGAIENANKGMTAGAIAAAAQCPASEYAYRYGKAAPYAQEYVDAYGGTGDSTVLIVKRYAYERGKPHEPENSWDCMGRLAEEVQWRRYASGGWLYYVADEDLMRSKPRMVIDEDTPGIEWMDFDLDTGKRIDQITLNARFSRWEAPPGTVVKVGEEMGPAEGKWLVFSGRRPIQEDIGEIILQRQNKSTLEPPPEVERQRYGGVGSKGGAPGHATGDWVWPVDNRTITSDFGPRSSPGGIGSTYHDGIDIGVGCGTPVKAVDGGKVTRSGPNGGYGNYIEIAHGNGLISFYGHLSGMRVQAGAQVQKGQRIGTSGTTGASTGCHLHFGTHVNGAMADPMKYLP